MSAKWVRVPAEPLRPAKPSITKRGQAGQFVYQIEKLNQPGGGGARL